MHLQNIKYVVPAVRDLRVRMETTALRPGDAADIFRWCSTLAGDASWVVCLRLGDCDRLEQGSAKP
jgi:hypothetical protein